MKLAQLFQEVAGAQHRFKSLSCGCVLTMNLGTVTFASQ
jgi:hypothetical protein